MFELLLLIYMLPVCILIGLLIRLALWLIRVMLRLALWLVKKTFVLIWKLVTLAFVLLFPAICSGSIRTDKSGMRKGTIWKKPYLPVGMIRLGKGVTGLFPRSKD